MAVTCQPGALQIKSNTIPFDCFTLYNCFSSKIYKETGWRELKPSWWKKKRIKINKQRWVVALKSQRGLGPANQRKHVHHLESCQIGPVWSQLLWQFPLCCKRKPGPLKKLGLTLGMAATTLLVKAACIDTFDTRSIQSNSPITPFLTFWKLDSDFPSSSLEILFSIIGFTKMSKSHKHTHTQIFL